MDENAAGCAGTFPEECVGLFPEECAGTFPEDLWLQVPSEASVYGGLIGKDSGCWQKQNIKGCPSLAATNVLVYGAAKITIISQK